MTCTLCDSPKVCRNSDFFVVMGYEKSHVVFSVMRYIEGCNLKVGYFKRYLFEDRSMIVFDAFGNVVLAKHSVDYTIGAIDLHVLVLAYNVVGIFDVVGMVVSQTDAFDVLHFDAILFEDFNHDFALDACIDEDAGVACAEIITVATASTAE